MSPGLAIAGIGLAGLAAWGFSARGTAGSSGEASPSAPSPGGPAFFPYSAAERSSTASRLGLDNSMTPAARRAWDQLALYVLQPLRARFGALQVTSGYRSSAVTDGMRREAASGGKPMPASPSQHEAGEAADLNPTAPGVTAADLAEYMLSTPSFPVDQVLLYEQTGHVHVSFAPSKGAAQRRDFRYQPAIGRTVPLTPALIAAWRREHA